MRHAVPSRRLLLSAALALAAWTTPQAADDAPTTITLKNASCAVTVGPDGVALGAADGKALLTVSDLGLKWSPPTGRPAAASPAGEGAARLDYRINQDDTGKARLWAVVRLDGNRVLIDYHLLAPAKTASGAPLKTGGAMLRRVPASRQKPSPLYRGGLWVRHERDGEPFEISGGTLRLFPAGAYQVAEVLHGNSAWGGDREQHLTFRPVKDRPGGDDEAKDDPAGQPDAILDLEADADQKKAADAARDAEKGLLRFTARAEYVVAPADRPREALVAAANRRDYAVGVATSRDFNLWETGDGDPAFTVKVFPARSGLPPEATVGTVVRDWDGAEVIAAEDAFDPAKPSFEKTFALDGAAPGIYFVECRIPGTEPEVFTRATLAVKEPYAFRHKDQSIFGLAAHFGIPSRDAVVGLMEKMGVRWLRNGDPGKFPPEAGFTVNHHTQYRPDAYPNAEKRLEYLRKELAACDARGNPYWELGNETKIHEQNRVGVYVDNWLKPLARLRKETGSRTRIMSIGFANGFGGLASLRAVHQAGGWDYIDAVAYHLGRGNFPPDTRNVKGWDFYRSLLALKKLVAELGDKPIHITEAYALTYPNNWWNDSLRIAPDSVVLSYAIGLAEGVEAIHWYQLHDSVWANPGGVNPKNREYHFGLLYRDGTPKPSFLAYCTIARALDGAKPQGYLCPEGATWKGIHFDTPKGPMTVLWDRVEGYAFSKKSPDHRWPDPWVKHYTKEMPNAFRTKQKSVTVVDPVGRRRTIRSANGQVTLPLTGSPILVHGLDIPKNRLVPDLRQY